MRPKPEHFVAIFHRIGVFIRSCKLALHAIARLLRRARSGVAGKPEAVPSLAQTHYERAPLGVGCECEPHRLRKEHPND